jgi:2,3-bisphosphoglycerate-dependent phosphoglycerate mutase
MQNLVLIRHGESQWNKENRFTGWKDVGLTDLGVQQGINGGRLLKENGFQFEIAYTSVLKRAIKTLSLCLEELDLLWIPVIKTWRLNERHYGALEGSNKGETAKEFGDEQVLIWRRSYDIPPPAMELNDPRYAGNDPRYAGLPKEDIPLTESLALTVKRMMPFIEEQLMPDLHVGKKIVISAHGNSIRALIQYLDKLSPEEILKINVPTGVPLIYELDDKLHPIRNYYLGDQEEIKKAMNKVAQQGKA